MEGVEDIPDVVLTEGLEWNWNSFSDYLNVLDNKGFDMDIGAQIPHGALRLYVMGQRGADRESATEDDIKKMAELSAEAIENGAIGFTTSRTVFHKTSKGELVPSFDAAGNELIQIAKEIGKTGKGVLQLVSDFLGGYDEFKMLEKMVEESGCPISITLAQTDGTKYDYKDLLGWIEDAAKRGLPVRAQACGRPIGLMLGLNLTLNPFSGHPSYIEIADLPLEERVSIMRNEDFRKKLLSEQGSSSNGLVKSIIRNIDNIDFENLMGRPLFIINGENDRLYPASSVEPFIDVLVEAEINHVWRVISEGGHNTNWLPDEMDAIENFKQANPRDPLPEKVVWVADRVDKFNRNAWVRVDELSQTPGLIEVMREENSIEVTARGVSKFTLLLNPEEIDFSEPVLVKVNGEIKLSEHVSQSVDTLLFWAKEDRDRSMLFTAELHLEVGD